MSNPTGRRWSLAAPAVAALLVLTGCGGSGSPGSAGVSDPPAASSPAPSGSAADAPASSAPPARPSASPTAPPPTKPAPKPKAKATTKPTEDSPAVLAASQPVSLEIPKIGTATNLLALGLRGNGTLEVPPDGPGAPASWFNQSPTPGERGPSVMLGHVNATDGGKGVFADLRALKPGDRIKVARKDGSTAEFEVTRGESYAKDAFPTLKVYGNTKGSELRLITCDGYDPATGEFDDNYVVYARLVP